MRGTQRSRTMMEATMPMIASGLHPSLLEERGDAVGAGGIAVEVDMVVVLTSVFRMWSLMLMQRIDFDFSGYSCTFTALRSGRYVCG